MWLIHATNFAKGENHEDRNRANVVFDLLLIQLDPRASAA
jgi:hypothetical protein